MILEKLRLAGVNFRNIVFDMKNVKLMLKNEKINFDGNVSKGAVSFPMTY